MQALNEAKRLQETPEGKAEQILRSVKSELETRYSISRISEIHFFVSSSNMDIESMSHRIIVSIKSIHNPTDLNQVYLSTPSSISDTLSIFNVLEKTLNGQVCEPLNSHLGHFKIKL
jgi:hypothetical protein